jgi:hypothetical protein
MELTLAQRAEQAEQATVADEFRVISEAALAIFGWQDDRYRRALHLLEAGASLDAAMMLVPEGATWEIGNTGPTSSYATVYAPITDEPGWVTNEPAEAATPALALCAAALRARASSKGTGV